MFAQKVTVGYLELGGDGWPGSPKWLSASPRMGVPASISGRFPAQRSAIHRLYPAVRVSRVRPDHSAASPAPAAAALR